MNEDDLLRLETAPIEAGVDSAKHAYRVVARGEIDLGTAPQLAQAFESLIDQGARIVVLDASEIDFVDSSGLRVIINCGNKLSAAGGRLLIEGMSGALQRVLEISGVIDRYRA
jgi:anti-sigma B factor antagonist